MLIQKDDQGKWSLKGVPWDRLYPGSILDDETWKRLFWALWRLMEYEDTGLEPEQVWVMTEKDRAVKPKTDILDKTIKIGNITLHGGTKIHHCSRCGFLILRSNKFCQECGKKIKWED